MLEKQRLTILKKVLEGGYTTEKLIQDITMKDIPHLCRSINDVSEILLLQKAVKSNKLISYLTGEFNDTKEK